MAVQTIEQIQRLPPYMEGLQKRLLQSVFGTFDGEDQKTPGLIDRPITLPDFKLAGLDPLQQMALSYAPQMFGSFQPYAKGTSSDRFWTRNCWFCFYWNRCKNCQVN